MTVLRGVRGRAPGTCVGTRQPHRHLVFPPVIDLTQRPSQTMRAPTRQLSLEIRVMRGPEKLERTGPLAGRGQDLL
ncbi:hypothetical protein O3P69_006512 [Scylla paramamosain]|uniref:Uncharacterized protein n=1 Tax=Scylla paramamosain TaxID=85552 RepID=A0AAW0U4X7_SCYPA